MQRLFPAHNQYPGLFYLLKASSEKRILDSTAGYPSSCTDPFQPLLIRDLKIPVHSFF
jgi:hypothetical protein